MFEDAIIVQSALSAFNNAALIAPAFLWSFILTLPLYILVWMFRGDIMAKIGWSHTNIVTRASFWVAIITLGWVVLFGGNYAVLRDDTSTLPFMVAAIVFISSLFVSSHLSNGWHLFKRTHFPYIALGILVLGLSDIHAWWGPVLQIGAACAGFFVGRVTKNEMRDVPGILLIVMTTVVAMLMQPEFFRFGQLGNLTFVHMLAMILIGALAMATVAIRNVNPSNKIHDSAYIKIKWMLRFVVILDVALFVMTESVPVFLVLVASMFALFALSVWHSNKSSGALGDKLYAMTILLFGAIITMPVICAVGIISLGNLNHGNLWQETKYLL